MPNFPLDKASIRAMAEADLQAVLAVQAACYPPPMQEPASVIQGRRRAAPGNALVGCDAHGVCAYVFAYPSRLGAVTALGAEFSVAPAADTLYVHDLAVSPRALGRGWARRLLATLSSGARAEGWPYAALVAVQDARRFWEAQGFIAHAAGQGSEAALATYPAGALYMVRFPDGPR